MYTTGWVVPAQPAPAPIPVPSKDLITTRVVEMQDGWAAQIIVCGVIAQEMTEFDDASDAQEWCDETIAERMIGLFQ